MKNFAITLLSLSFALLFANNVTAQVALGDAYVVDQTWYEIQQTSSVGKMVGRDDQGGTHITWTWMESEGGARHIGYAFADDGQGNVGDQLAENAAVADQEQRSGYGSLTLRRTEEGDVPVLFYHGSMKAIASYDFSRGWAAFTSIYFDPPGDIIPINTKGCVSRNGNIFVSAGVHNPMAGDPYFNLTVWPAIGNGDAFDVGNRHEIELTTGLSHAMTASKTSDQVAMIWHHNIIGVPPADEEWAGRLEHQMNNDIYAVIADDGENWDWDHPINITKTILPDPNIEGLGALGDTLRPYADLDAIYVGDVLHVVFTAKGFWADLTGDLVPPVDRLTTAESFIWHWDSASDTLTLVADGWFVNNNDMSGFDGNVCKPSLGVDEEGNLYCVYQRVIRDDVADGGYNYTDIFISVCSDGVEWSEGINLTDTHPGNNQVEYIDERYVSLAERVDESLHISYLARAEDDGFVHAGRFVYQRVAVADLGDMIPLDLPREGFTYHNSGAVDVAIEEPQAPVTFGLTGVFPNPFNNRTRIDFNVGTASDVTISVSDITGRLVGVLVQGRIDAGSHMIDWNAIGLETGVYFVRMSSINNSNVIKTILIK